MNLKSIMWSESRQTQNLTYCMIPFSGILEKTKLQGQESNQWLLGAVVMVEEGTDYKGAKEDLFGIIEMCYISIAMIILLYTLSKFNILYI